MNYKKVSILRIFLLPLLVTTFTLVSLPVQLEAQDRIPREYTNPDEVVTFDRSTSFQRALDVINEFAQEYMNKVIIDRTNTESDIGISVPPMHWRDALDLMLRVKNLALVEQQEFFEIIPAPSETESGESASQTQSGQQLQAQQQGGQGEGDGPPADIHSREVRINAIFFEGSRRALQEIGVDWSTLSENVPATVGNFVGDQQGGGGGGGGGEGGGSSSGQLPATSGFEDQFVSVNAKGAQNVSQNVFNALINFGQVGNSGIEVQALISAFEADNLGEILASPTVKVMDGEEGRIQVGQDFSIKQRDFAGNVTDQFFSVGTILSVTPTIIEQRDTTIIHLDVMAERSSAQPDPVSTIVNKQTAETQAILVDGEATAIAGLYRSEVSEVRRGVPVLKDLPPWLFGLRYLFGYNSKDYQMRELVILVQAEIEPTIAERYDDYLPNKFEVLNEQRRQYRQDLERKNEYSPTQMDRIDLNEDPGAEQPKDQPGEQQENREEPKPPTSSNNDSASTQQNEDVEEDLLDPEMTSEPVELNLGGENENKADTAAAEPTREEQEANETETTDSEAQAEPATQQNKQQAEPEEEMPALTSQDEGDIEDFSYFVIGSSFRNKSNAVDYRERLRQEGFNSFILTDEGSSFHFVAYRGYKTQEAAESGLADIREYYNSKAWLFIKQ